MASFLELYASASVLLAVAWGLSLAAPALLAQLGWRLSYAQQLRTAHALIAASLLMPFATPLLGHGSLLPPAAQIWSGPLHAASVPLRAAGGTVSLAATGAGVQLDLLAQLALASCLGGAVLACLRLGLAIRSTARLLAGSHGMRRQGALRILVSSEVTVPLSCWLPGRCAIVVPMGLLGSRADLRLVIRHEAQHHRQGDTRVVYLLELLRGAFLLNPAVHLLLRHLQGLQELACDAAVVRSRGSSTAHYCECLLRVAEGALAHTTPLPCLQRAAVRGATQLARRIRVLLEQPAPVLRPAAARVLIGAVLATLVATAMALPGTVEDRRISAAQAEGLAQRARALSSVPIVMNPEVLEQLNQLLGTAAGRTFSRRAVQGLSTYEATVTGALQDEGVPAELLAIPFVESGYRNLPPDANPMHGAGLWMLIPDTARASGLTVEGGHDERLDPVLESRAAARLLSGLYAELGDWGLVVLAYNSGRAQVEEGMAESGTRDAFRLSELGHENDPHYVARVMAAIIVLKNADRLSLD